MKEIDLVLKGGGAKIPALAGAILALEKNGFIIKRVAGTSAGAIIAALYASGYSGKEIVDIVKEVDMGYLAKDLNFPIVWNWLNDRWGIYKGNRFEKWMKDVLAAKQVKYFKDTNIDLRVFATDLTNQISMRLDGYSQPFIPVAKAVRMSMSIPFVFKPVKHFNSIIVDGGLLRNYPIKTFDNSKRLTIGIRLIGDDYNKSVKINNGKEFAMACVNTMMAAAENEHIEEADWARTIQVNTGGVKAIDFNISKEVKSQLVSAGWVAVDNWVKSSKQIGVK